MSLRRLCAAVPLVIVLACTAALLPVAAGARTADVAADAVVVPQRATVTIAGRGFGHGHGMSQYGAAGAAAQGLSYAQILAFYYPGTALGPVGGTVSVMISADTTSDVRVRPRAGLAVRRISDRRTVKLPTGRSPRFWRLTGRADGRTVVARKVAGGWQPWRIWRGEVEFTAGGAPITLALPAGRTADYRGRLRAVAAPTGGRTQDTVNIVSLEKYLRGVVPAEMPAHWHPQALRAQAVAARTYAAFERLTPRGRTHQLCDTTACQVYRGVAGEHPRATEAVKGTRGQAVLVGGAPAFTQFSASSGGWLAPGSRPYLAGQADPYDAWAGNPVHTWQTSVPDSRIEQAWPAIGDLRRLEVVTRDGHGEWGGRVRQVRIAGSTGAVTVTGDAFRFALGLRSTYFTLAATPR